jgi:hypothetical protein
MSELSAVFRQGPSEVRRYLLDYTLELQTGEEVTGITVTITSPSGENPPLLVVNNITVASGGLQAFFYASAGTSGQTYEAKFLATTTLDQVFEDVVKFIIQEKT